MKKQTYTNYLTRSCLALALALAMGSPDQLQSADPVQGKEMKMENKMKGKCEEMKKQKQEMQAEMKAQDAEIAAAVATMNSAAKDKKIELMADIVTRLVEQRTAMHAQKAMMEEKMMKHMMEHMEMGKETMAKCPMMMDMDKKSDGAHLKHHEKSK